jgi:hypothetical protein
VALPGRFAQGLDKIERTATSSCLADFPLVRIPKISSSRILIHKNTFIIPGEVCRLPKRISRLSAVIF